jgi:hypothetical protein
MTCPVVLNDSREWIEVRTFGDRESTFIPGPCRHPDPEPIVTVAGETVGWLCPACEMSASCVRAPFAASSPGAAFR